MTTERLLLELIHTFQCCSLAHAMQNALERIGEFLDITKIQITLHPVTKKSDPIVFVTENDIEAGDHLKYQKEINIENHVHGFVECVCHPCEKEALDVFISFLIREIEHFYHVKELRKIAFTDHKLGVMNNNAFLSKISELDCPCSDSSLGVLYLDVNNLKMVNDRYGHDAGDRLIQEIIDQVKMHFDKKDIYRVGGDEFVILLDNVSRFGFSRQCKMFKHDIKDNYQLPLSIGYAWGESAKNFAKTKQEAEEWMYKHKQEYHKANQNSIRAYVKDGSYFGAANVKQVALYSAN